MPTTASEDSEAYAPSIWLEHTLGELVSNIIGIPELGDKLESLVSEFSSTMDCRVRSLHQRRLRHANGDIVHELEELVPLSPRRKWTMFWHGTT